MIHSTFPIIGLISHYRFQILFNFHAKRTWSSTLRKRSRGGAPPECCEAGCKGKWSISVKILTFRRLECLLDIVLEGRYQKAIKERNKI